MKQRATALNKEYFNWKCVFSCPLCELYLRQFYEKSNINCVNRRKVVCAVSYLGADCMYTVQHWYSTFRPDWIRSSWEMEVHFFCTFNFQPAENRIPMQVRSIQGESSPLYNMVYSVSAFHTDDDILCYSSSSKSWGWDNNFLLFWKNIFFHKIPS